MTATAVVIALAAACCYAIASTLQHLAARRERPQSTLDPRLLARLLRRPIWLAGGAADIAGAGLHATALAFGPLSLVQPLLVSGLVLAIPLEATMDRRRPRARDLVAVVLSGAGLAIFVIVADPMSGDPEPSTPALATVTVGIALAVSVLLGLARRRTAEVRAGLLGVATGLLYGFVAALAKACVARFEMDPWGLLVDWRAYTLILVGVWAIALNQNAFQAGRLAAPLIAIALTDPAVSLIIGVTVFSERLNTGGIRLLVEILAVLAMVRGLVIASTMRTADRKSTQDAVHP